MIILCMTGVETLQRKSTGEATVTEDMTDNRCVGGLDLVAADIFSCPNTV